VAALVGAAMLWLAGGPFDGPPPGEGRSVEALELLAPRGEVAAFPRRFEWRPLPAAALYEITVVNEETGAAIFRQRGPTARLDLDVEPGSEPPPGAYVWEVIAIRDGQPLARGGGRFRVAEPAPPGP
jgi:hypothetical protein